MNTVDLYKRRTLLAALSLVIPVTTFLRDTFFSMVQQHDTDTIDIDVIKGGQRLAPFVSPKHAGKPKEKRGYNTFTYKIPYIKELITMTAHELLTRDPGKTVYDEDLDMNARAIKKIAEEFQESVDAIHRREEWMCSQILHTGKVICKGEGIEETVDFLLPTEHTITLSGTALWSAAATAKPIDNLTAWSKTLAKKGKTLTDVIMGSDALDYMLATAQIGGSTTSLFNLNRINLGEINPQLLAGGVRYIGRISSLGIDMWTYDSWFADDTDGGESALKPMIDPKKVICIAKAAKRTLHYGAIQDLDAVGRVQIFPKVWKEENPSAMLGLLQSAPLPAAHDIEGILVAKVLA